MKLLYLPLNVAGDEQFGAVRAFASLLGEENVCIFDYLAQARLAGRHTVAGAFLRHATDFKPDWIHMQIQSEGCLPAAVLREVKTGLPKTIMTHWMGDWRARVPGPLREICKTCDVTFISNEGQIPMYREFAPRVEYWQNAVTLEIDVEPPEDKDPGFEVPEVVFCGTNYAAAFPGAAQRLAIVEAFANSDLDFGVVGGGWPGFVRRVGQTGPRMQIHIYRRAKVSVGVNNINDCTRYYSERQLSAMASGIPHVCWAVPGLEKDFVDGEHCVFYGDPREAVQKARELLSDPERASRIGAAGKAEIIRKHLWTERVKEILPLIESLTVA